MPKGLRLESGLRGEASYLTPIQCRKGHAPANLEAKKILGAFKVEGFGKDEKGRPVAVRKIHEIFEEVFSCSEDLDEGK